MAWPPQAGAGRGRCHQEAAQGTRGPTPPAVPPSCRPRNRAARSARTAAVGAHCCSPGTHAAHVTCKASLRPRIAHEMRVRLRWQRTAVYILPRIRAGRQTARVRERVRAAPAAVIRDGAPGGALSLKSRGYENCAPPKREHGAQQRSAARTAWRPFHWRCPQTLHCAAATQCQQLGTARAVNSGSRFRLRAAT